MAKTGGQTIILSSDERRREAAALMRFAPVNAVVTIKAAPRTLPQNARMWAMLGDLSRARPDGRTLPTETWKALAMDAAGHVPVWEHSLDGDSMVCLGYKSSRLDKEGMGNVMAAIEAFAAQRGIELAR
jgi:hypothetical protein